MIFGNNDLIHIQFREKMQVEHINYVAESFNFLQIVAIMLREYQICCLGNIRKKHYFFLVWK
jgi:hypothetical protein